jgi:hypothetical protein
MTTAEMVVGEAMATSVFAEGEQPGVLRKVAHFLLGHLQNPSPSEHPKVGEEHVNGYNVHFEGEEYRG